MKREIWLALLCVALFSLSAFAENALGLKVQFSLDDGKTYLDEAPTLPVGSRLLLKTSWQGLDGSRPAKDNVMTFNISCAQGDFASANRGLQSRGEAKAWLQRPARYWFNASTAGSFTCVVDLSARREGVMGSQSKWDAEKKAFVDAPLPACAALPPGNYAFEVSSSWRFADASSEQQTDSCVFVLKVAEGAAAARTAAVGETQGRRVSAPKEEWLPSLTGERLLSADACVPLLGAGKVERRGVFILGGSDCGWRLENVPDGDFYIRLMVDCGADGVSSLEQSTQPFVFIDGVPAVFDHASESCFSGGSWFAVIESAKPMRLKNGSTLRLSAERKGRFGGAALSRERMKDAPQLVSPLSLPWLHDRFKTSVSADPSGRVSVVVENRSDFDNACKIECQTLDFFQRPLGGFSETASLKSGERFAKDLNVKPSGDRFRVVVKVEDSKGFKTEKTVEALRDDLTSFRKKMWLVDGWEIAGVPDDGTLATRTLRGIDGLPAGAKWRPAPQLPARCDDKNCHVAWFRKSFSVPKEMKGAGLFAHFTRALYDCRVFLDGKLLASHEICEGSFDVDLGSLAGMDGERVLLVELRDGVASLTPEALAAKDIDLNTAAKKGPCNLSGGLGEVWLFTAPEHGMADVFPKCSFREKTLNVDVEMPPAAFQKDAVLEATVLQGDQELLRFPKLKTGAPGVQTLASKWSDPPLWGPEKFPLLRLLVELKSADGALLDRVETRFGFREFWAEGMDLKWNGVKVNFASRPFQSFWGCRMNERPKRDKVREAIQLARRNGCDMLRHIYDPDYYADAADEEGMPIIQGGANTVAGPSKQVIDSDEFWGEEALAGEALVKSLRSHPSIFEWYLSNEFMGESERRNGERLAAYGEKTSAFDKTRIREFGCDLDLHGASPVVSVHYPVDIGALRENGACLPESFYWRYFNVAFRPGMNVPQGMVDRVANVVAKSPATWGVKPIVINECCWISFFAPPDGFSRATGDEVYRGMTALNDAHHLANKLAARGHRDAQVSAITLWTHISSDPNFFAIPKIDVNILQRWNKFRGGAEAVYDVNISRDLLDSKTLSFVWELRDEDGKALDGKSEKLSFSPCELKRASVRLKLPDPAQERSLLLTASLKDGAETLACASLPLRVSPSSDSAIRCKAKVGIFAPSGDEAKKVLAAFPEALELSPSSMDRLAGLDLLIIGENQQPGDCEKFKDRFAAFVENGGTLLLLKQSVVPDILPFQLRLSGLAASTNFCYRPSHPLAKGLAPDSFDYWLPLHKTGSNYYIKPQGCGFKTLTESGGPRGLEYAGALELQSGKGSYVATQLDLMDGYAANPAAWRFLRNVADFASLKKTPLEKCVFIGEPAAWLARAGATACRVSSPDELKGVRAATWNAATSGTDSRMTEALKSFVVDGGTLLVLSPEAASKAELEAICGRSLTFRHAIPPAWTGRAVVLRRSSLIEGLNNYDFFWKTRPETENCSPCYNSPKEAWDSLGGATVEADGVEPLLYPSHLLEIENGKGKVLLCSLNLGTSKKRAQWHAARIASTIFANMGVRLSSPASLRIPEGLDYQPLDISSILNRSFIDEKAGDGTGGWSDQGPDADLRSFPTDKAVQVLCKVPFRIEKPASCLVLSSKFAAGGVERAEIPVGRSLDALFFLQSSAWTSNAHHASYIVEYADGSSAEIKLVGGVNLRDWASSSPDIPFVDEESTVTQTAWTGSTAKFGKCSLFMMAWPNPRPETPVKAIEVKSMNKGVPILVAVTAGVRKPLAAKAPSSSDAQAKARAALAQADALFKDGDVKGAERLYRNAIELAWETADARLGLGYCLERQGRRGEAIAAYEDLAAVAPKLFEPYKCLGRCYEADANWEMALETYRRSLEIDVNQPDVMAALERVKAKLNK